MRFFCYLLFCCFAVVPSARADYSDEHPEWFGLTAPPMGGVLTPGFESASAFIIRAGQGATFSKLVAALAEDGEMLLIHAGPDDKANTEAFLVDNEIVLEAFRYIDVEALDQGLAGDYSPFVVSTPSGAVFVDPRYFPNKPHDDAVGSKVAIALETCSYRPPIFMTRGYLDTNGAGLCVVTSKLYGTNPGLTAFELDQVLENYLGCTKVISVQGLQGDSEGRLDTFFRFGSPTLALAGKYEAIQDSINKLILESTRDKLAAELPEEVELSVVPMPSTVDFVGTELRPSYLNFIVGAKHVLVPVFPDDTEFEQEAFDAIQTIFHPGHQVLAFDSSSLLTAESRLTSALGTVTSLQVDTGCSQPEPLCDSASPSECDVCFDECLAGEILCLSDTSVGECSEGEDGCLDLVETPCKGDKICQEAECVAAPTICDEMPPGGVCDDLTLKKCVQGALIAIDCWASGQFCSINPETGDAECMDPCESGCQEGEPPSCNEDGLLWECKLDQNGCFNPTLTACADGAECIDGACLGGEDIVAELTTEPPEDAGPTATVEDPGLTAGFGKSNDGCSSSPHGSGHGLLPLLLLFLVLAAATEYSVRRIS